MKIKDNIAVVTGGGSGMGEAVCCYLAEQGAKIVVLDKSENAAVRVANKTHGMAIGCDVRPLSILVNCAGVAPAKRILGKNGVVSLPWFEEIIQINLVGTFNMMRLAAEQMSQAEPQEEGERGIIINTASIAAFEGQIGQTAYSASKGGVVAMTLPAARELARFGIRVMTIAPGFVDTPMVKGFTEEVRASLITQTVFPKRFAWPEEFASLVGHIINNQMLNGEVIRLDGGVRMGAS
jgi:NAD(P)-dependent dehydrogenase (short-subunit alcohol dehydrogenase family)